MISGYLNDQLLAFLDNTSLLSVWLWSLKYFCDFGDDADASVTDWMDAEEVHTGLRGKTDDLGRTIPCHAKEIPNCSK